jgi:GxxExxY protein
MKPEDFEPPQQKSLLAQEGYDLMGAAFEVHRVIGGGLLEEVYQEALERELHLRNIPFVAQQELAIEYKGQTLRKTYVPDLYVYGAIVVELKCVSALSVEHEAQLMNYMRLSRKVVGYLINFAPIREVQWKRFTLAGNKVQQSPPESGSAILPRSS